VRYAAGVFDLRDDMAKLDAIAFDADAAIEHMGYMGKVHLAAIHRSRAGDIRTGWFGTDYEAAVAWAMDFNAKGYGLYVTVNEVREGFSVKPDKTAIHCARFCHVDLDPPKQGGALDKAAILETLDGLRCPPSFVIESGAGIQAYWRIEASQNKEAIERINMQIRGLFGADACHNIDRLFRLAGSQNYPNATKEARGRKIEMARIAVSDTGEVYEPADLAAFFPKPEEPSEHIQRLAVMIGDVPLLTPNDMALTPFNPARMAIERPKNNDRSVASYHATCEMVRDGFTDAQIAGILLNPANPISGHCLDQGDPRRAVERLIGRARGEDDSLPVPAETKAAVALIGEPKAIDLPADTSFDKPAWVRGIDGPMRLMVETIMEYAPSPRLELALGATISTFATAAGRRYQSPTGILTNIYIVALMASGAGKDYPLRAPGKVLTYANAGDMVGGRIVSAMGIRSALEANPALFLPIDEMGKLLSAINNPKGAMRDAIAMLLELYSEAQSFAKGGMYANTKERATSLIHNPCLSFFGVATPATFWESLTYASVSDGFLPRMLLLIDKEDEPEPKLDLSRTVWPDELIEAVKAVISGAEGHNAFPMGDGSAVQPKPYEVRYADESARKRWFDMKMEERVLRQQNPDIRHPFYNRLAENATKLALVRAVNRAPLKPELTVADFEWGHLLSRRSIDTFMAQIDGNLADSDYHARLNKVREVVRKAGAEGISGTELGRRCTSIPGREREDILRDLEGQGLVIARKVEGAGRPKNIYVSVDFC
jgi:hypothetical protein